MTDRLASRNPVRIGMVNFINTAPFYEIWLSRITRTDWQVVEATPARLCRMLAAGELDLGVVSSHEYAQRPESYFVMDDLSISSSGSVGSVFLFSHVPVAELDGRLVLLSAQSQTSNSLVQIILEDFCHVRPRFIMPGGEGGEQPAARLAIGDEALRLNGVAGYPVQLDLGDAWLEHTGLPFVFAVWAVRREFYEARPQTVSDIRGELLRCIAEGRRELAMVSARVASRIPMSEAECLAYLGGIEYDLTPAKKEGLERFFRCLVERGEGRPETLPIHYCR